MCVRVCAKLQYKKVYYQMYGAVQYRDSQVGSDGDLGEGEEEEGGGAGLGMGDVVYAI